MTKSKRQIKSRKTRKTRKMKMKGGNLFGKSYEFKMFNVNNEFVISNISHKFDENTFEIIKNLYRKDISNPIIILSILICLFIWINTYYLYEDAKQGTEKKIENLKYNSIIVFFMINDLLNYNRDKKLHTFFNELSQQNIYDNIDKKIDNIYKKNDYIQIIEKYVNNINKLSSNSYNYYETLIRLYCILKNITLPEKTTILDNKKYYRNLYGNIPQDTTESKKKTAISEQFENVLTELGKYINTTTNQNQLIDNILLIIHKSTFNCGLISGQKDKVEHRCTRIEFIKLFYNPDNKQLLNKLLIDSERTSIFNLMEEGWFVSKKTIKVNTHNSLARTIYESGIVNNRGNPLNKFQIHQRNVTLIPIEEAEQKKEKIASLLRIAKERAQKFSHRTLRNLPNGTNV